MTDNDNNLLNPDDFVEVRGQGNIYGIPDKNNKIYGSKKKDTIYSYNMTNIIEGGKADDTIRLTMGEDITNQIRIKKDDGNDTIYMNWYSYSPMWEKSGIPNIVFDKDGDLSYEKCGSDLIIKSNYSKKKYSSAKVKNYFKTTTDIDSTHVKVDSRIGTKLTVTKETGPTIQLDMNEINLSVSGFLSDKIPGMYVFEGSDYDDTITGNNKLNDIYTFGGNNTITTGKKGKTVITSVNDGNDTINITSLAYGTVINNTGGEDNIKINVSDLTDIHTVKLGTSLLITTTKGLSSLANYSWTANDYTLSKNLKGCFIKNYFNGSGEIIENATITAYNKNEDFNIRYNTEEKFVSKTENKINAYLYSLTAKGLNFGSVEELLSATGLTKSEKKKINSAKTGLIDLYKNWHIGTDSSNSFIINKNGAVIESGYGSDIYTFKGNFNNGTTIISSELDFNKHEKDTFIFKNYSFESHNLFLGVYESPADNDCTFEITTVNYNKKSKLTSEHNVIYFLDDEDKLFTNSLESHINIRDSKRSYDISGFRADNIDIDLSKDTRNHIISSDGLNTTITSNASYNLIYSTSTKATEDNHSVIQYNYNGGSDYMNSLSEYSDDIYNMYFSDTSNLMINDLGGDDTLNIAGRTVRNLRLLTDVKIIDQNNYEYVTNRYIITDPAQMKRGNITSKDGNFYAKNGLSVAGDIETIYVGYQINGKVDLSDWLSEVADQAAGWLYSNKWGYLSTTEVLESGNKTAIDSLLKVYANVSGNFYN